MSINGGWGFFTAGRGDAPPFGSFFESITGIDSFETFLREGAIGFGTAVSSGLSGEIMIFVSASAREAVVDGSGSTTGGATGGGSTVVVDLTRVASVWG